MSKEQDTQFLKTFSGVLATLVMFTIVMIFLARAIGSSAQKTEVASDEATAKRIAPVGEVAIGEPKVTPASVAEQPPTPVAEQPTQMLAEATPQGGGKRGKEVYDSTCFVCHTPGVAGAPKLGDKEAWVSRIGQGIDTLVNHAIKGFQGSTGVMPPKGGRMDLSDEDIKAAVEYMVNASQ